MTILGFGFKKISIEREGAIKGKLNINHNASLKTVEKSDVKVGGQKTALKISFEFKADYQPDIAKINLQGELLWVDTKENIDSSLKQWEKEKKLPKEAMVPIYNAILHRSIMQSLTLSKDLNLPPPIRLPRLTPENVK